MHERLDDKEIQNLIIILKKIRTVKSDIHISSLEAFLRIVLREDAGRENSLRDITAAMKAAIHPSNKLAAIDTSRISRYIDMWAEGSERVKPEGGLKFLRVFFDDTDRRTRSYSLTQKGRLFLLDLFKQD